MIKEHLNEEITQYLDCEKVGEIQILSVGVFRQLAKRKPYFLSGTMYIKACLMFFIYTLID